MNYQGPNRRARLPGQAGHSSHAGSMSDAGHLASGQDSKTKEKSQAMAFHWMNLSMSRALRRPGLAWPPASILKINTSVTVHLQSLDTNLTCHPSSPLRAIIFSHPVMSRRPEKRRQAGRLAGRLADRQTDRWKDGPADGRTDRRTDGLADGLRHWMWQSRWIFSIFLWVLFVWNDLIPHESTHQAAGTPSG